MEWGDLAVIEHVPQSRWLKKWGEYTARQNLVGKTLVFCGELKNEPFTLLMFKGPHSDQDILWPTAYVKPAPEATTQ